MKKLALILAIATSTLLPAQVIAQQTGSVKSSVIVSSIELEGVVEAVQQSTVSAQTSGAVVELPVDVDDPVAAGQLIVRLDDTEQTARVNRAKATQQSAEATLTDAVRRYQRIRDLFQQQVASRSELDAARTQLETSQAQVAEARAAYEQAQKQLSYTRITAPYAGIVTERFVELGESVQPGQPLMSGLSLEQLRVITDLPQSYAQQVRQRRQAQIVTIDQRTLDIGSMTFYPYADQRSHTFRLRLNLTDPEGSLFPGMLVKVHVAVGQRRVLQVAESAVISDGELRAVYVVGADGEARLRQIRIGEERAGQVEILAGLTAGEQVLLAPQELNNE